MIDNFVFLSMDQVFFSFLVLFIGNLYMLTFSLNTVLKVSLSWFVGCAVIVASYIISLFLSIEINFFNIILIAFLGSTIFNIIFFINLNKFSINKIKQVIICILISFIIVFIINFFSFIMSSSPDSFQYFIFSHSFHDLATQDFKKVAHLDWWFQTRLIFLVAIHNLAKLFGLNLFNLFFPITSIFFIISFFILILELLDFSNLQNNNKKINIVLSLLAITLILTNYLFLYHSVYYHTNFLTMTYFTLGSLGICLHIKKKNLSILIASVLALSLTCLIRKEMILFSLIPLIFLNYKELLINYATKLKVFIVFLFGYSYGVWHIIWANSQINILKFNSHGSDLLYFFSIILLAILTFTKPFKLLGDHNKKKLMILGIFLITLIIFLWKPDETTRTIIRLVKLMFTQKGHWVATWYLVFVALIVSNLDIMCSKRYKFLYFNLNKEINLNMQFLCFVMTMFLFFRIILYVIFNSPADHNFNSSGNRVLLHIYPIGLALVFYLTKILSFLNIQKK